jgi:serine/threonine protein kinase
MTIATGTKLGPYEITGAIGAGGMGEVYRAHDPKLGRDVAIKVLPEAFARDAERMFTRFDVTKDGRFLIPTVVGQFGGPITIVVNWTAGLKK